MDVGDDYQCQCWYGEESGLCVVGCQWLQLVIEVGVDECVLCVVVVDVVDEVVVVMQEMELVVFFDVVEW